MYGCMLCQMFEGSVIPQLEGHSDGHRAGKMDVKGKKSGSAYDA